MGARHTTVAVATSGDSILILEHGRSSDAGRILDVYSSRTGQYRESYRLPVAPSQFAMAGQSLALLVMDPVPVIQLIRPRRK